MLFLFLSLTMLFVVFTGCFWLVHLSMIMDDNSEWGWGNFTQFLREFNKVDWERDERNKKSFFGKNNHSGNYIHASIIKFSGKCMALDYFSYLIFECFLFLNAVNFKNKKVNWGVDGGEICGG